MLILYFNILVFVYGRGAPKGELCNKVCMYVYVSMHRPMVAWQQVKEQLKRFQNSR